MVACVKGEQPVQQSGAVIWILSFIAPSYCAVLDKW